MSETSSSGSAHLSVAMTTTDVTQTTGENSMTSSSSNGAEFYSQYAVILMGIVGTSTNALILYAMIVSKQYKKHVLIFHQNVLDFVSCVLIVIIFSLKVCNFYLSGTVGYLLCTFLLSGGLNSSTVAGSVINLAAITIERYLKIVHSAWSQKNLRKWMIYSVMAFAWLAGFIYNLGVVFPTTAVVDGTCFPFAFWQNEVDPLITMICAFVIFYVIVLLIFFFCYWRILAVIRRQAAVMASHGTATGSSTGQTQSQHIQSNVIKTMILVCVYYAILYLPNYVCAFLRFLIPSPTLDRIYHMSLFLAFLYTSTNPFIYVLKFDPVKKVLLGLFSCTTTNT